jgi:methyl-accepting chemotaxis protein
VALVEAIAEGNLRGGLELKSHDEMGRFVQALNTMTGAMKQQLTGIMEAVNILGSTASEIARTVVQFAESTSRTSSAVSETSTTTEQVKQSAYVVSQKANTVSKASQKAVAISDTGRKASNETVDRMKLIKKQMGSVGETVAKLSEHGQAIEDIIGAVQDLADQSNLLAVNASIEAARAGEQGKGFAVVAHEIKTLADQSKEATEQVRTILQDTRKWVNEVVMTTERVDKAVEAGVEQSVVAGEAIGALANSISEASLAAGAIDTSAEQQLVGVDQVGSAMKSIDQAAQQNIAGAMQIESAARKLEEVGGRLKNLVDKYRV